jgi:hypothetical protein
MGEDVEMLLLLEVLLPLDDASTKNEMLAVFPKPQNATVAQNRTATVLDDPKQRGNDDVAIIIRGCFLEGMIVHC